MFEIQRETKGNEEHGVVLRGVATSKKDDEP
jgi:hypothetical protein